MSGRLSRRVSVRQGETHPLAPSGLPLLICILVFMVNSQAYGSSLHFGTVSDPDTLDNSDNL